MKKFFYALLIVLSAGCGTGSGGSVTEKYHISHTSVKLTDNSRNARQVTAELFYPSSLESESIADGKFSLIVFAHGYQQLFSDYSYIYKKLTPMGYILAYLTTEQGVSIDIDTYAKDIAFLHKKLLNSDTVLSDHLSSTSALMGHSTGAGAIYIADNILQNKSTTIVSMAALGEVYGPISGTNPIDIAHNITTSSLVFAGSKDCITPYTVHQIPLFNNLKGEKELSVIEGGDHCGFTNSYDCPIAEAAMCGLFFQDKTINEQSQREIVLNTITVWLKKYLDNNLH